jgi:magnesium chelatase subunit I
LFEITSLCIEVGVDGHRGDIIILKTAKTIAAWEKRNQVESGDIKLAAELALPHRVRRQPLQEIGTDMNVLNT